MYSQHFKISFFCGYDPGPIPLCAVNPCGWMSRRKPDGLSSGPLEGLRGPSMP